MKRFVSVLLVGLFAAGCSSAPPKKSSESKATPGFPVKKDKTLDLSYSASSTGDLAWEFSEKIKVRVLTIVGTDPQFIGVQLLSVGPAEPVALSDGTWFRIAFDLVKYTGDGKYKIRAGSPSDLIEQVQPSPGGTVEPPDQSNVLVQRWTTQPAPLVQPETFNHTLEPCPLESTRDGKKGSLICSQITDDNDRVLSITMRWG